jgi:hypothetical protein
MSNLLSNQENLTADSTSIQINCGIQDYVSMKSGKGQKMFVAVLGPTRKSPRSTTIVPEPMLGAVYSRPLRNLSEDLSPSRPYTDHPITVWAGAILLRLYFELIGLRGALAPLLLPFAKTSNNQIPTVDVLLAWWYGLALGAERFEHFTRYRRALLPRLLGVPRFASADTLRRFFQGFTYQRTTEVTEALMRMSLATMRPIL